jgi:hypothetical protein
MPRCIFRSLPQNLLVAAALAILGTSFATGQAQAVPTCTSTIPLPTGSGLVLMSSLTAGVCVAAQDKTYGNFDLGNLPTNGVLIFNLNTIAGADHHQLSFDTTFAIGTTYDFGYEVGLVRRICGRRQAPAVCQERDTARFP